MAIGSYFKEWAALQSRVNPAVTGQDGVVPFFGQVLEVTYDSDKVEDIGKIKVKIFGQDTAKQEDAIASFAYPADKNIIKYPLPGELVLLSKGLTDYQSNGYVAVRLYYTSVITSAMNITYNANPYYLNSVGRDQSSVTFTGDFERRFEKSLVNNESIIENGTIKKRPELQPFEGDFILQSRWGSAIRFGSTGFREKNQWSNKGGLSGNPITIITVNRSTGTDTVVEDINKDDSSIYLCSTQIIPIQLATAKKLKSYAYVYDVAVTPGDLLASSVDTTKYIESQIHEASEAATDNINYDEGNINPSLPVGVNGNLSPSQLKTTSIGIKLEAEAADAWDRLVAAARAAGVPDIGATGGYRPYSVQSSIFDWDLYIATGGSRTDTKPTPGAKRRKKGTNGTVAAAFPGTSNHGWGRSVDASGVKFKKWLKVYGWIYGWSWYEGKAVNEDWHFTYTTNTAQLKSYVNYTDWNA